MKKRREQPFPKKDWSFFNIMSWFTESNALFKFLNLKLFKYYKYIMTIMITIVYNLHNLKFPFHYQYHERDWKCATGIYSPSIYNMLGKSLARNYINIMFQQNWNRYGFANHCSRSLQST